jgi:hypothetical protein
MASPVVAAESMNILSQPNGDVCSRGMHPVARVIELQDKTLVRNN